jgi:serine/threonine protein phosphatase PrpC
VTNPTTDFSHLDIGACSHVGRREHNEDRYLIDRELGLVIVADGVGGHHSGEVASAITCEVIRREVASGADLRTAIERANTGVLEGVASGRGKAGMASTVVAARLAPSGYELAWVGDSRIYLWDGKLRLLSRDHSFVEEQITSGLITREEARNHPRRNVILRAVGTASGNLEAGTGRGQLAPGTCLLLCSDGITDPLDSPQLCALLSQRTGAEETCQRLVDAAYQAGGKDNITALLVVNTGRAGEQYDRGATAQAVWVFDPDTAQYEM